jgi:hypothetical protein
MHCGCCRCTSSTQWVWWCVVTQGNTNCLGEPGHGDFDGVGGVIFALKRLTTTSVNAYDCHSYATATAQMVLHQPVATESTHCMIQRAALQC